MIKLYSYYRSSSSYRVRIALNLKGLEHEIIPVHLLKDGGEQFSEAFTQINQAHKIPALDYNGDIIAQSVAIIEFLDEAHPETPLLPKDRRQKALARQLIEIINSDIQPLQNLAVLKKLIADHNFTDDQKVTWIRHWISLGFESYEALLQKTAGEYSVGDTPSMADCFLIPQVYNAKRFQVDLSRFPTIARINEKALKHPAFIDAHPDNQIDTPKD